MSYLGREPRLDNTTLTPRATAPTPAFEGMLYRDNGTALIPAGVYEFRGGSWQPLIGGVAVSNSTDAVLYSPSFPATWGSVTQSTIYQQRVGNDLLLRGWFRTGTHTTGTASIPLPSGLLADYTRLSSISGFSVVGTGLGMPTSTAVGTVGVMAQIWFMDGTDQSNVFVSTNASSILPQKQPATGLNISSNTNVHINVRIPIVGWTGSNPFVALNNVQFNTDQNLLTFKSTAIVTADPVGTFNTFTYAANANTPTISGSAPSQTTTDMALNGLLVTGRAYNAASTAASPTRFDVKVGTGLRGEQIFGYVGTGKTNPLSFDSKSITSALTTLSGVDFSYDPISGIATINAGLDASTLSTTRNVGHRTDTSVAATAGYFVLNAGQQASLTAFSSPIGLISYWKHSVADNTAPGGATAGSWVTRPINVREGDTTYNTFASNQITLFAGTYHVDFAVQFFDSTISQIRFRNVTDGTSPVVGLKSTAPAVSASSTFTSVLKGTFVITSTKVFELQARVTATDTTAGYGWMVTTFGELGFTLQGTIIKAI